MGQIDESNSQIEKNSTDFSKIYKRNNQMSGRYESIYKY